MANQKNGHTELRVSRNLFWAAFLAASVVSALLGQYKTLAWPPALAAALIMIAYLAVVKYKTPEVFDHPDFPDAFYYLGFLLTLVALVLTLYQIDPRDSEIIQVILQQFGLALTTTIVGLVVRTILVTFREGSTSEGPKADSWQILHTEAETFRIALQNSATDFETTLSASIRSLEEAMATVKPVLVNAATELDTTLGKAGTTLETAITSAGESVAQAVTGVTAELDLVTEGLQQTKDAVGPLANSIQELVTQASDLSRAMSGSSTEVANFAGGLTKLSRESESLEGGLQHMLGSMQFLEGHMSAAGPVVSRFGEALEKITAVQPSFQLFVQGATQLAKAGDQVEALVEAMEAGRREVEAFASAVTEATTGVRPLSDIPAAINIEALGKASTELTQQLSGIKRNVREWKDSLEDFTEVSKQLAKEEQSAASALQSVNEELAASVAFLKSSVRGTRDG
jgi:hypothetical protein